MVDDGEPVGARPAADDANDTPGYVIEVACLPFVIFAVLS